MKKFGLVLLALVVAVPAFARTPITKEKFTLFREPFHTRNPNCDTATVIEIDYISKTATLENRVIGFCEIAVRPDKRVYRLTDRKQDSCNSWNYLGEAPETNSPFFQIKIRDNRSRTCEDRRATLEVLEQGRNEQQVRRLYSEQK